MQVHLQPYRGRGLLRAGVREFGGARGLGVGGGGGGSGGRGGSGGGSGGGDAVLLLHELHDVVKLYDVQILESRDDGLLFRRKGDLGIVCHGKGEKKRKKSVTD